jgi:hypothetical protein
MLVLVIWLPPSYCVGHGFEADFARSKLFSPEDRAEIVALLQRPWSRPQAPPEDS